MGLVHWDDLEGWYGEGGGLGWGTHVYLGQIHFDIWQDQYNIVKLNKIKKKKKETKKKKNPAETKIKKKKRGAKRSEVSLSLLSMSFGPLCPHASRMYFPLFSK